LTAGFPIGVLKTILNSIKNYRDAMIFYTVKVLFS
jgi:hypothetical protein